MSTNMSKEELLQLLDDVTSERVDLAERIACMTSFVRSDGFKLRSVGDRDNHIAQLYYMQEYSRILNERLQDYQDTLRSLSLLGSR